MSLGCSSFVVAALSCASETCNGRVRVRVRARVRVKASLELGEGGLQRRVGHLAAQRQRAARGHA